MSNDKEKKGHIGVSSDNIFPIIKKFLYSDHEIFLRELVSNAVDATQKLKTLSVKGEYKGNMDGLQVEVRIEDGKLIIADHGVGMTREEIEKYINQIAISGAEEFVQKYKDDTANIIGHFGLGFYSAFMVASRVEIFTQSYQEDAPSMHWSCDGSPEYTIEEIEKRPRGTEIVLHITDEENKSFLEREKIQSLLSKYCHFLPIPIVFGKKQEWKDGKYVDTDEDNVINNVAPAWTKAPQDLEEKDYLNFYRELYPMSEDPLFWIHLNIDYPFNLTGILYFPKIKSNLDISKHKIQLYCNQVFVTDSVEGIVPDFLTMLHGVLDSPDIPLNVSRSYLQSDGNVKKISSYITRKVAERLEQLFKEDRKKYEEKWEALDLFVKYGMLTDEKFYERAQGFCLLRNAKGDFYSIEEYTQLISATQTDKDGKLVHIYATDKEKQYSYIRSMEEKGYDVLLFDGQLDVPFLSMLEQKQPNTTYVRVDSDTPERIIHKADAEAQDVATVTPDEQAVIEGLFESQLPKIDKVMLRVSGAHHGKEARPVMLIQNEFMRRMKDMANFQQGMNFYGEMPDSYELSLNLDSTLIRGIAEVFNGKADADYKALIADKKGYDARLSQLHSMLDDKNIDDAAKETTQKDIEETNKKIESLKEDITKAYKAFGDNHKVISQLIDLALLANGMLTGASLDTFISRSMELIGKKEA